MIRFIKTTILGGILFLVPIVIFFAVIGKAQELTSLIAAPLAERCNGQVKTDTGLSSIPV